ncbi:glycosyltransferase [Metabacillus fastidiosus]|uniref:glycosyltransferase n=1 Tax=Metabacillus fastidiosus TaxID=1458 RepID=UPI003D274641
MEFSVLMSLYDKEKPDYLQQALESLVTQTLLPNEIVIVKDGPLPSTLEVVLKNYMENYPQLFLFLQLEKNMGLGLALQHGVNHCRYPIIARMDSDDVCHPQRFEKQITYMIEHPHIDTVGSWICEFQDSWKQGQYIRKVPLTAEEIKTYSKKRNPLNHMTVMFRKKSVLKVGNYLPFPWNEDYYLWVRLLHHGYTIENISEPLVFARANQDLYRRRGGLAYMFEEYRLQRKLYSMQFINWKELIRNILIRVPVRIVPNFLRVLIYKTFLREKLQERNE